MKLFNPGSELANLIISGVLQLLSKEINACDEQSSSSSSLSFRYRTISQHPKGPIVITFSTSRDFTNRKLQECPDLVSSSSLIAKKSFDLFQFLLGKGSFAINRAAITLFDDNLDQLSQLKDEISNIVTQEDYDSPVIVTGHSLGGSIASLFTLWLLDSINFSHKKRPICITFGSPLLGDTNLQKALSKDTPWSSCFLHVASNQDPVPRMFSERGYKPFGTFLLCSESGCTCFEEPETVLTLLSKTASRDQDLCPTVDYGKVVDGLKRKALFKNMVDVTWCESPYHAGIVTQLSAIGVVSSSPPEGHEEIKTLAEEIEKSEMKFQIGRTTVNPNKKLNNAKIYMAKVEWYKKTSNDIGYYDSYKKKRFQRDINIEECVKRLMNYWADLVEEVDMKPQSEIGTLRTAWLFAGLNYRRLVEPLHIAEYHHEKRGSNYMSQGRPKHFARLEALVEEAKKKEFSEKTSIDSRKKNVSAILTQDSCFWARLEQANISCELMKSEARSDEEKRACVRELSEFEDYVLGLIKNYTVSPEIFKPESSFMKWWKDYKELHDTMRSYGKTTSPLNGIMNKDKYKKYFEGQL